MTIEELKLDFAMKDLPNCYGRPEPLINEYLNEMTGIVLENKGTDKALRFGERYEGVRKNGFSVRPRPAE